MMRTVEPSNSSWTRRVTMRSVFVSMLAVASSRIKTFLRCSSARASTTSCFSPADKLLLSTGWALRKITHFSPALRTS